MAKTDFETAMKTLENCAEKISDRNVSLEDAMKNYQEGIAAYKVCRKILEEAEQTVKTMEEELS